MKEIVFNQAKTVSLTGHRNIGKEFDKNQLKKVLISLTEKNFDTFLVGMAIGFDTEAFKILSDIKKEKDIKIIACIPCPEQSKAFDYKQKKEYDELVEKADGKIIITPYYTKYCMMKRNKFMVDNSSVLVAYVKKDFGGSYRTTKYAEKKEKEIIRI